MIQDERYNLKEIEEDTFLKIIKNRFVVGLDFDGVITAPHTLKSIYLKELGYAINEEEVERKHCIQKLKIKEEDYNKASSKAYLERPEKLPLEIHFDESFAEIKKIKEISLIIVTSRYDFMLNHLQEYLKYHKLRFHGIINTNNESKIDALKRIHSNIFIDDGISKLEEIAEDKSFSDTCTLILYRNIQNKNAGILDRAILEIDNWISLKEIIQMKFKEVFK
ncbi:hypothetical protein J4456_00635 [Candidatus Pacearchaeota archaeon]|nr:hypothetical protein [Candidatus Pacearchaeota archaeon]